ncbi:hypothetical protein BMUNKI379_21765 [Burkholderia multivorans]|nr:hypothetical protein BMUNKI379_21765 [Burkholderia multivorans]
MVGETVECSAALLSRGNRGLGLEIARDRLPEETCTVVEDGSEAIVNRTILMIRLSALVDFAIAGLFCRPAIAADRCR